jgi:3-hydroxyacyl-CoA dehydrogenase/enoyl-CoA hydratase/3-hydroxybutyryl-CoA epimerase
MLLVELIMGKETGENALALAMDYVRAIKKTPIVVNDARGFYANRCVGAYIREAHLMLMDGVPAAMVENAGKQAGMPVGPLALNDEVAVDLALKVMKATKLEVGENAVDPVQEKLLVAMVEKEGRLGRKNRKGFYDYPEQGQKRLWPGLATIAGKARDPETIDFAELKSRLLACQALEAARAVEEGIVTDVREADVGSIIGFGFAPFTGGTLSYIDGMGVAAFVAHCDKLAEKHGPRFKPCALLKDMAAKGETFYRRFDPAKKAA